jgi:phosphatidylglycerophosphate synthase
VIDRAVLHLVSDEDTRALLLPVAGRPVALRVIVSALRAGVREVVVPARWRGGALEQAIAATPSAQAATVWLDATTAFASTSALLIPATVVASSTLLARLRATSGPAVHAPSRSDGASLILADGAMVAALESELRSGLPMGDAIDRALKGREVAVVAGDWSIRVSDVASAARAEDHLYAGLGSAIDTRLDRALHRRLSRPVSRRAVTWGITPNQLSVASLLVGLVAVAGFAVGTPASALLGLVLYTAAVVLDHADGEVARLSLRESRLGEWLDVLVDTVVHALLVMTLGLVADQRAGGSSALMGAVAAVGVVLSAAVAKISPAATSGVGGFLAALGSRDGFYAMLVLFIAALTWEPAWLPSLMVIVAVGSHAYWIGRGLYALAQRLGVPAR